MVRITALILTLFSLSVHAASVWKVSDGTHTMYFGGTLHILSPDDYPLPGAYARAYDRADALVFETDIAALSSPDFAAKSLQRLTYTDATSLRDHISDDTLDELRAYLQTHGIPLEQVLKLKPALVGITLSMVEFQRIGLTSQGVDKFYHAAASDDGKPMHFLETPEEQLDFIAAMGSGDEDAYIRYAIKDVQQIPGMLDTLKANWREGDMSRFHALSMAEFEQAYPEIYDLLLTQRNNNWMPALKSLMATPATEFVLVGAMHMPGDTGLLAQLRAAGYTVEQL
ncbi:TraB/GumN family protein [Alteromonas sp. ASW11-19]|uniref:TraB/GumN family protein n=1 Tax=Alteromonas salexigens TaxID=2982530 RepID=A0ABT2VU76_9ALTE|nr:TraB/GumN family protein [Alteromonas salexigens]MCU7555988.1 TraB/GumN family protein [Alteromonas salexigens]